jgi:general bacterial porin, GBP family
LKRSLVIMTCRMAVLIVWLASTAWAAQAQSSTTIGAKLTNLGARYSMGPATLGGSDSSGTSSGTNNANAKVPGHLLGTSVALGPALLLAGYATSKTGSTVNAKKFGPGYHYFLSRRTKIYADIARDSAAVREKKDHDIGLQHSF